MTGTMNAFLLFSQYHRQSVKDDNPGICVTDVAKILGQMWRALSEREKNDYKAGRVGSEESHIVTDSTDADDEDEDDVCTDEEEEEEEYVCMGGD